MVLPARGDAHSAFVTLAAHTSSRENEVQPVVSGAMRLCRARRTRLGCTRMTNLVETEFIGERT
jgi:hypothetical protein